MNTKWSQFFHTYGFHRPLGSVDTKSIKDGFLPLVVAAKAPSDAKIWALYLPT